MADDDVVDEISVDSEVVDAQPDYAPVETDDSARRRLLNNLSPLRVAMIGGLVVVIVLGGLCGWLGYRAYQARQAEQLRAMFVEVGRQGALNLTTLDFEHADDDVKRILDSATGEFYDDFEKRSGPFADVLKKTQAKSVGTITEAGLASVNGDEGEVLVAVNVKTTNKAEPGEQPPRFWRMRLTVQKFGDEAKISKVDFVS